MKNYVKGALIASAVAGLVMTVGCSTTPTDTNQQAATGKCVGGNECKGQGACEAKDGSHTCSGKNECKGKGWMEATEADCKTKGGTFEAKS